MSDSTNLYVESLDETLYRLLDADTRSKKKAVEAALTREYGGEKKGALDIRIEHREQRIDMIESELADLRDELEQEREELAALKDQRDELDDREDAYERDLGELLDRAESGDVHSIIPAIVDVRDIAEEYGKTPEEVATDAKARAIDDRRDISARRFEDSVHATVPDAPVYDVWGDDE